MFFAYLLSDLAEPTCGHIELYLIRPSSYVFYSFI
jgi:hypothetical protein